MLGRLFDKQEQRHAERSNKRGVDFLCGDELAAAVAACRSAGIPACRIASLWLATARAGWKPAIRQTGSLRYEACASLPRSAVYWQRSFVECAGGGHWQRSSVVGGGGGRNGVEASRRSGAGVRMSVFHFTGSFTPRRPATFPRRRCVQDDIRFWEAIFLQTNRTGMD